MPNSYSRLERIEKAKNIRSAFIFILVSALGLLLFIFAGLPTFARISSFLFDLKGGLTPFDKNDITPPAPPRFEPIPETTNNEKLEIKGSAEPGSSVVLYLNTESEDVLADSEGKFNFQVTLSEAESQIWALSKDSSGNKSQQSLIYTVILDKKAPEIEIISPAEAKSFYGSKQRQQNISGKSESGSSVFINERVVVVEAGGTFSFATTLSEGDNTFNIKAQDAAGNFSEKTLTLHFFP